MVKRAVKHSAPWDEMPKKLYIISDVELDGCINNAGAINLVYAKKLFKDHGYELPEIVF